VRIDAVRLALQLVDKQTNVTWSGDPWEDSLGEVALIERDRVVAHPGDSPDSLRGFASSLSVPPPRLMRADLSATQRKEVTRIDDGVRIVLMGFPVEGEVVPGRLVYEVTLPGDGAELIIRVTALEIDDPRFALHELHLPLRAFALKAAEDTGCLVFPYNQGIILPVGGVENGVARYAGAYTWSTGMLPIQATVRPSMRWFGARKGESSFIAIIDTPDDAMVHFVANDKIESGTPRIASLHPVWLGSHLRLGYARSITYRFIPGADHVRMAKAFREYARKNGLFRSMDEKVKALPAADRLLGAPVLWTHCGYTKTVRDVEAHPRYTGIERLVGSFDEVLERLRYLKRHGVERAFVVLTCWERTGGGVEEPDHWPPNPKLGGLEQFKKIFSEEVARELPGYLLTFYNIYNDMYANAPSFDRRWLIKNPDGSPAAGGYWQGGLCYLICPTQYRHFADRDFAEYHRHLRLEAMFYDNVANLQECFDPDHPLTRTQHRQVKSAFLDHTVAQGWVTGVEVGTWAATDWMVPHLHFVDGIVGAWGWPAREMSEACVLTPLWDLVFHDAVVNYWWHWNAYTYRTSHLMSKAYTWQDQVLVDILCANPGSWTIRPVGLAYWAEIMQQVVPLMSALSRGLARVEMTDHAFLSPDTFVQTTRWGDGTEITVNFGDEPFEDGRLRVPAKGFHMANSPVGTRTGSIRSIRA